MISFDEASARIDHAAVPLGTEQVPLARSSGRVLARPVVAAVASPPSDVSAMDGYAVRTGDLASLPARLPIAGRSYAGNADPGELPEGACMRVFTGAPVPRHADRVVVQEAVRAEGQTAVFDSPSGPEAHIRRSGSDFPCGTQLLAAGTALGPRQLIAAAAADRAALDCFRRPRIALFATGDELAEPGTARDRTGAIPESISHGLAALLAQWGGQLVARHRVEDDAEAAQGEAAAALGSSDLVVVIGGASVGEKDLARNMFAPHGLDLLFSKVAMKPGKPVWFGRAGATLVIGLPGNPTSAMVTARLLLAPLTAGLAGRDPGDARRWRRHELATGTPPIGARETFLRARLDDADRAHPLGNQQSHAQHALAQADLLIRCPPHAAGFAEGDLVETLDF